MIQRAVQGKALRTTVQSQEYLLFFLWLITSQRGSEIGRCPRIGDQNVPGLRCNALRVELLP